MDFATQKKNVLSRKDNSRKGEIDEMVASLIKKINALGNYYTTSSCAGRIMVYEKKSEKKFDTRWLYVSHELAEIEDIKKTTLKLPPNPVWFREEPMMMHICARNLENAEKMLMIARECGFKRSGMMATSRRIVMEITGTEIMDTIIADKGKMLVGDSYIARLVKEANRKLERNFVKIAKFEKKIVDLMK